MTTTSLLEKLQIGLLLALFFILPFQKKLGKLPFSNAIIPTNLNLPEFFSTKMHFYLVDILVLTFTILCLYQRRHTLKLFFFNGPAKYLIALFLIAILSVIQSTSASYAISYYRLLQFLIPILLFCSILDFCSSISFLSFFRKLGWVILATALIQSTIGIIQFLTQSTLGFKSLGEHAITLSCFAMNNTLIFRCGGTFSHPNIFGGFLFFSILITYYLFCTEKNRLFLSLCLIIQSVALLFSFSRAAIFAYLLASLTWFGITLYHSFQRQLDSQGKKVIVLAITVFSVILLASMLFYPQIASRGGLINRSPTTSGADQERVVYQKMAWEMFKDHPVLGVGFNNFQLFSPSYAPKTHPLSLHSKVHNSYLLILSEMGICGLLAFLLFLCSLFKNALRSITLESATLFAILIGFLFINGCDFYLWDIQNLKILFFGMAAFLWASQKQKAAALFSSKHLSVKPG